MKESIVIAGFSGIGKTELAKKYKNVIDLDAAKYVYDDSDILNIPFEKRKGMKRMDNPNWPQNYIDAIKDAKKKYNYILVWDRPDIVNEYIKNKIEFILCYPNKDALKNYVDRYLNRGNSIKYTEWKLKEYSQKLNLYKDLNIKKIILSGNETLEDYLLENFNKLCKISLIS